MVRGIDSFREWFRGYEDQYAIIGGTALERLKELKVFNDAKKIGVSVGQYAELTMLEDFTGDKANVITIQNIIPDLRNDIR